MIKIYIDEAGRGPLAGPLYVGLVLIADKKINKKSFKDSKVLTEKKREEIFGEIQQLETEGKIHYTVGISDNKEIDKYGMTRALNLAISRGVYKLLSISCYSEGTPQYCGGNEESSRKKISYKDVRKLCHPRTINYHLEPVSCHPEPVEGYKNKIKLIIDGNRTFGVDQDLDIQVETIVDGDAKIPEIGMASIIAKVCRDRWMVENAHKKYPKYGFERHKGYGTKLHKEMIEKYGICPLHRKLFLKRIYPEHKIKKFKNTTKFSV